MRASACVCVSVPVQMDAQQIIAENIINLHSL